MKVLIATRNKHKVEEIRSILGKGWTFLTLDDVAEPPLVVEDAPDFAGNATRKAVALAEWVASRGIPIDYVMADDSGLEVDALNGAPGVHSARFAALDLGTEGNSTDAANNAKLLRLLQEVPREKRTGRFKCVIAFTPVPANRTQASSPVCSAGEAEFSTELFAGACEGRILEQQKGTGGFGYDPLFVPDGFDATFAELGEEVKNRISHRSRALKSFQEKWQPLEPSR